MSRAIPVDMLLVEFPGDEFAGEIVTELERLVSERIISILDLLLVRKSAEGDVGWAEADQAEDERLTELAGEPVGLLADEDAKAIGDELEPGSAVGLLVFEHTWAVALAGAVRAAGGGPLDWTRIPESVIGRAGGRVG